MNTQLTPKHVTSIISARGKIGEIIIRPDWIVRNNRAKMHMNRYGQWMLMVGPRSYVRRVAIEIIVGIANHEEVRVLDCGEIYNPIITRRFIEKKNEVFQRVILKHVKTPEVMLYTLDNTSTVPKPFVALDILRPFYTIAMSLERKKDNLKGVLQNLRRLEMATGGMVCICPQVGRDNADDKELIKMVQEESEDTFDVEVHWDEKKII